MQFDERARDGKTKSGPFHSVGQARAGLLERSCQPAYGFGGYANAKVLHINFDESRNAARSDTHPAAAVAELNRVPDYFPQQFEYRLPVDFNRSQV